MTQASKWYMHHSDASTINGDINIYDKRFFLNKTDLQEQWAVEEWAPCQNYCYYCCDGCRDRITFYQNTISYPISLIFFRFILVTQLTQISFFSYNFVHLTPFFRQNPNLTFSTGAQGLQDRGDVEGPARSPNKHIFPIFTQKTQQNRKKIIFFKREYV